MPPLPSSHRERLLPTSPDDVPTDVFDALTQFCGESPEVERGYVCAMLIERDEAEPERRLSFCVKLRSPVSEPQDSRHSALALLARLSTSHPEIARAHGFGVSADRAVAAYEANAVRVYDGQPRSRQRRDASLSRQGALRNTGASESRFSGERRRANLAQWTEATVESSLQMSSAKGLRPS